MIMKVCHWSKDGFDDHVNDPSTERRNVTMKHPQAHQSSLRDARPSEMEMED